MGRELKAAALAFAGLLKSSCNDDRDLLKAKYTENNGNVEFVKKNRERVTLNELIGDGKRISDDYKHFIGLLPEDNDQNLGGNNPQRRTFGAGSEDDAVVDDTEVDDNISGNVDKNVLAHAIFATKNLSLNDEKTIRVCVGKQVFDPDDRNELVGARDHLIECLQQTLDDLKEKSPFVSGDSSALLTGKMLRLSELIKDFKRTKRTRGIFKKKGANDFSPGKLFEKAKSAGVRFVAEEFADQTAYRADSEIDQDALVQQILALVHKHRNKKDVKAYVKRTATDMNTTQLEDYKTKTADLFNQKELKPSLKLPVEVAHMDSDSFVVKKKVVAALDIIESSMSPDGPDTGCPYFVDSIYNRYYQRAIKKDVSNFKKAISNKKGKTVTIEELESEADKRHLKIELSADVEEEPDNQPYNDNGESDNALDGQNVDDISESSANSDNDTHSDADFYKRDPFLENYDGLDDEENKANSDG